MYPKVHCSTIYNSHDMDITEMSINRGMDKEDVYTYIQRNISHEQAQNNAIYNNMDGTKDCHTE